ncbi:hypothetical protein LTR91_024708 [Friedmanniomyces endolithicus]|uniref:Uncharacterized protein n=1 Tax=Friedmanniomyces endolithicus TaxID=329885 RepID=A0AAN6H1B7_9PEZI|nr:hypothetical protein LTR94_020322 [Friedmanniomyces endolithicus]KAK0770545.1 hypothetical protein LTR59_016457 [Friedmanniomyces endolithicus]KAK0776355.1 hypothetical protein LTR75_016291 [Friedmanniomyces endolithicus]KAK0783137.1 hypothetical protein LTR38_013116 [Friedmanniomyces endolithicus]KAK0835398.1 hypothetical protein LTR03_013975 [Friedmanniomyces endolithicus]
MASEKPVASATGVGEADLAKAFQELAKGERAAAALENQLTSMEAKIEALLAQAEKEQEELEKMKAQRSEAGESGGKHGADAKNADGRS